MKTEWMTCIYKLSKSFDLFDPTAYKRNNTTGQTSGQTISGSQLEPQLKFALLQVYTCSYQGCQWF